MNFEPVFKGAIAFFLPMRNNILENLGSTGFSDFSSEIFGSSAVFGNFRKSSEMIGNRRKMAENFLVYQTK